MAMQDTAICISVARAAFRIFCRLLSSFTCSRGSDAPDTAGQDSKAAEHMSMDILGLCGVFRFLKEFFHAGHAAAFLGLLDPVPHKDMKIPFQVERRILFYRREPTGADGIQRPG